MTQDLFDRFDDLTVVSGDPDRPHTFTLTGIVHNEMHFLPVFLQHYRALGVDRFVFLDDQSDDGTLAFLAEQTDVVVLHSQWRYSHRLTLEEAGDPAFGKMRIATIWRNLLLRNFCSNVWSLHLDADEFLDLPPGQKLQELAKHLDSEGVDSVWSIMLDMYPATAEHLMMMRDDAVVDFEKQWFFDGRPHLRLRDGRPPRTCYAGFRARLMMAHNLNPKANWFDRYIARHAGLPPKRYNAIRKPIMLRWREGAVMHSAHAVSLRTSHKFLLPLRHYKFNGSIVERIEWALKTGAYSGGSAEYFALEKLLAAMHEQGDTFLCRKSIEYKGFKDFSRTGNALGFD